MTDERKTKVQLVREMRILRTKLKKLERTAKARSLAGGARGQGEQRNRSIRENTGRRLTPLARKERTETPPVSKEPFRTMFEDHSAVMLVLDAETGAIVNANKAAALFYGWSIEELKRMRIQQINTMPAEVVKAEMEKARLSKRIQFAFRHRRADGSIRDVEVFSNKIEIAGKGVLHSIIYDTTDRKNAEEALRKSEQMLKAAEEAARLGYYAIDIKTGKAIWSDETFRIFGLDPSGVAPTVETYQRLVHKDDIVGLLRLFDACLKDHKRFDLEYRIVHASGEVRHVHSIGEVQTNPSGIVVSMFGTLQDVTERKLAQEQMEMLKHSIDVHPDGAYWMDNENKFVYVNDAGCKVLGYEREELIGHEVSMVNPKASPDAMKHVWERLRMDRFFSTESVHRRKDGSEFPVEIVSTYLRFGDKEYNCGFARDITERKRAEKELRDSEEQYRMLFESNPHPMWVYDTDTFAFLAVNGAAAAKYGYTRDEFLTMTIKDIRPDEDIPRLMKTVERIRGGLNESGNWRHRKKDGEIIDVEIISHALTYEGKRARLVLASDITERRRVEQALRQLSRCVEQSPASIMITDTAGKIEYVNPRFSQLTGYSPEEVIGKTPGILKSGETTAEEYRRMWETILSGGEWRGEFHNKRKNGRLYWESATISPIFDANGGISHFLALKEDITERRRMEKELQETLETLRAVIEATPVSLVALDPDGIVTRWNPASERMFGWSGAEALGKLLPYVSQDKLEEHRALRQRVLRGESFSGVEVRRVRRDGSPIDLSISTAPIRDDNGVIVGIMGVNVDVTARKRDEQELKMSELRMRELAAHLESVREEERKHMAQEFHDELGQTLTALKMDLTMLQRHVVDRENELSRTAIDIEIDGMQQNVDHAIGTIREIMAELRPELLDHLGILPALEFEAERFHRRSGISCSFASLDDEIQLDQMKSIALFRIFQETLTNVLRHAQATHVNVKLEKQGDDLIIQIKDDGIGIPMGAEKKPHSFGLIGMRERTILLGGKLTITGVRGEGTTIVVTMPLRQTLSDGETSK